VAPLPVNGTAFEGLQINQASASLLQFGQFDAMVQSQCGAGCPGAAVMGTPIQFVNLPTGGDESLTRCVPWTGPNGTPPPWGGDNATPPQVLQLWDQVQTIVTAGWKGDPKPSIAIFFASPQKDLFGGPTVVRWDIEDDPTVPMDQSNIVLINNATSSAQIAAFNSGSCMTSGVLNVVVNETVSMMINMPGGPPFPATTLFFKREFNSKWYDIAIFAEQPFWSIARGRRLTFTWQDK
jgi:hypothetical protein